MFGSICIFSCAKEIIAFSPFSTVRIFKRPDTLPFFEIFFGYPPVEESGGNLGSILRVSFSKGGKRIFSLLSSTGFLPKSSDTLYKLSAVPCWKLCLKRPFFLSYTVLFVQERENRQAIGSAI